MCCTTLFKAGTAAAAAKTDGIYLEQAQTEVQSEKSEEELIQEIKADPEVQPDSKLSFIEIISWDMDGNRQRFKNKEQKYRLY